MSQDLFNAFTSASVSSKETTTADGPAVPWIPGDIRPQPVINNGFQEDRLVRGDNQREAWDGHVDYGHDDDNDDNDDDDDFGDFENAAAAESDQAPQVPTLVQASAHITTTVPAIPKLPSNFSSTTQQREDILDSCDSRIGKHPFAGHMDFLFERGEDDYDAGVDDLNDLANNPEAAMAYSKLKIADQEAQAKAATRSPVKFSAQGAAQQPEQERPMYGNFGLEIDKTHLKSQIEVVNLASTALPPEKKITTKLLPEGSSSPVRNKLRKKSGYAPTQHSDVLFDMDDLSEHMESDEDFGEFENGHSIPAAKLLPASSQNSSKPILDLLDSNDVLTRRRRSFEKTPSSSTTQTRVILGTSDGVSSTIKISPDIDHIDHTSSRSKTPRIHERRADFSKLSPPKPEAHSSLVKSNVSSFIGDDDAWDDFDAAEPAPAPAPAPTPVSTSTVTNAVSKLPTRSSQGSKKPASEPLVPPINIPPPAVLLSVVPLAFSSAQDTLFGPLSRLGAAQRTQLLSHASALQYLRSLLHAAHALAHIIAGRKSRWKRDQMLAQSMRIGPAAAGGKGGMKLVGVDRSEVAKEDREVLDTVRLYKEQLGKLRSAVATASSLLSPSDTELPIVPEIHQRMPIKTLNTTDGGFVAPHACALCGLKREERVAKVDEGIEDSFGEWWVQGMDMHVTCRSWWVDNKDKLRSK